VLQPCSANRRLTAGRCRQAALGRDLPVTEHLSSVAMNVSDGGRAALSGFNH
jgi:hypothetical protein